MEKLIIIGAGGHGRVVADIAVKMGNWESISFLDDESTDSFIGVEVIGPVTDASKFKHSADFIVGLGDNTLRHEMQADLEQKKFSLVNVIHPDAAIGAGVSFGIGNVVMAGVVINTLSKIGNGCIINTSSSVDHDNVIEDYVHVCPGAHIAGSVHIGINSLLGIGCAVSNNLKICRDCTIGAGAVIIKDIEEPGTYIGIPAIRIE